MIYLELLVAFLQVGLFSFGGAYGAIPLIRDVVLSYGWLDEEKLVYMIAVSESTPGPIMVNLATYVGNTQGGILGAIVATTGVVLPSFIIISIITVLLKNVVKNPFFQAVLRGLKPCVIGIILATGLYMIVSTCTVIEESIKLDLRASIILVLLIGIKSVYRQVTKKKFSSIMLILLSAIVGVVVLSMI